MLLATKTGNVIGAFRSICCHSLVTDFCKSNGPRSIYQNSNMTPRLSGHFSVFSLIFFVLKSPLGIARQWSREQFATLSLKPRSHVRF